MSHGEYQQLNQAALRLGSETLAAQHNSAEHSVGLGYTACITSLAQFPVVKMHMNGIFMTELKKYFIIIIFFEAVILKKIT